MTQPTSNTGDGYDIAFKILLGILAVALPLSNLAWLGGQITSWATGSGPDAPYQPVQALLHPARLWPRLGETSLLIGTRILPAAVLLALGITAVTLYQRYKAGGGRTKRVTGMAKRSDVEPLMTKAVTSKARSLRPSLKDAKHIAARDTGVLLGNLQGTRHEVRMGFEDVAVAIMAPRSGKTTSLAIPSILNAPGAVLLTSNKAANDAFTATLDARGAVGRVWTMDPQQIAHATREMWWNPLADAKTLDGAGRLAGHFLAASVDASQQGDFWSKAGSNVLSQLFLAAALDERPITDVMQWLAFPADRTPLDILRDHDFTAVAAQLKGTVEGPPGDPRRHLRDRPPVRRRPAELRDRGLGHPAEGHPRVPAERVRHLHRHPVPAVEGRRRRIVRTDRRMRRLRHAGRDRPGRTRRRQTRPAHARDPRRGRQRLQNLGPAGPVLPPRLARHHPDHDPPVLPPGPEGLGRRGHGRHVVRRNRQGHRLRYR